MKKFFSQVVSRFSMIVSIILILFLFSISLFSSYLRNYKVEIDRYFINSEVTHFDYSYSNGHRGRQYSKYIISIRNEEFTHTFEVSSVDYAKYKEGDFINVEVKTLKDIIGKLHREYKIVK